MLQHQTKESCPVLCATTKNSVLEEKLIGCYLGQLCCFHLFFLLSPTINTSPPSPQLLSYPKHVVLASVIQGWVKNLLLLQGLGKAEQTWLCSHLRGTNEDIQVSLKAKSQPSTRATPMGTRDAVAVPKLPIPCRGLSGDIPALTPLSPTPQVATTRPCCSTSTWGSGSWTCSTRKCRTPIEGEE